MDIVEKPVLFNLDGTRDSRDMFDIFSNDNYIPYQVFLAQFDELKKQGYEFDSSSFLIIKQYENKRINYRPAFVQIINKKVQLANVWVDLKQVESKYLLERLANMKVDKFHLEHNRNYYNVSGLKQRTKLRFQKNLKRIAYNLLKRFNRDDFPERDIIIQEDDFNSYDRICLNYKNNSINILAYYDNTFSAYIYEKNDFHPIWTIDDKKIKETFDSMSNKLQELNA